MSGFEIAGFALSVVAATAATLLTILTLGRPSRQDYLILEDEVRRCDEMIARLEKQLADTGAPASPRQEDGAPAHPVHVSVSGRQTLNADYALSLTTDPDFGIRTVELRHDSGEFFGSFPAIRVDKGELRAYVPIAAVYSWSTAVGTDVTSTVLEIHACGLHNGSEQVNKIPVLQKIAYETAEADGDSPLQAVLEISGAS